MPRRWIGRGRNRIPSTVQCSPRWCTGSPDHAPARISSDSSSIRARRQSSTSSPVIEYSLPNSSLPRPTPSVSLPPLSRSSVAVSLATLTGRRRAASRPPPPRRRDVPPAPGRRAGRRAAGKGRNACGQRYLAHVPLLLAIAILLFAGVPAASGRTIELGTAINNGGFTDGGTAYRAAL